MGYAHLDGGMPMTPAGDRQAHVSNQLANVARPRPSIGDIVANAPWSSLEAHLNDLRQRIDAAVERAHRLRDQYRKELLAAVPEIATHIRRPRPKAIAEARHLLQHGTVAASDGTVSAVPLLSGSKIQVGVVMVANSGQLVELVTRIFEHELPAESGSAQQFFTELRRARRFSNLLSRAVMLFGERRLLLDHPADWRMLHGELIPHELRTCAGDPARNLPPVFELIHGYIRTQTFLAVSESSEDIDVLNAAALLEPGEFIEIRPLTVTLTNFLEGTEGQSRANFNRTDRERFRQFIETAGPEVSVVLTRAGQTPFLIECHRERVEEAVALFMVDSIWSRGLEPTGANVVRGFPFHIDLADHVARTLFKGSDFERFVESRLASLGVGHALFDISPRRTR